MRHPQLHLPLLPVLLLTLATACVHMPPPRASEGAADMDDGGVPPEASPEGEDGGGPPPERETPAGDEAAGKVPPADTAPPPLPSATRPEECQGGGPRVTQVGRTPGVLRELSGLTASRRHPGIFWAHNDSDNAFVLYAVDAEGRVRATFPLVGVQPLDVEDVAVGPCEAGTCILLGDIGDNGQDRGEVRLLRLPEPQTLESRALPVEVLPFTYEDGAHDAESLVVEPATGRVFVLTKTLGSMGELYMVEGLGPARTGRATRVTTLPAQGLLHRASTGASLSPDGARLLVRTYFGVWEWAAPGATRLEEVVQGRPHEVPGPSQPQAEAVAWLPDGSGYLLGSEEEGAPLFRVDCLVPPQP